MSDTTATIQPPHDDVLLVHPQSLGRQISLRPWFVAFFIWLTALVAIAYLARPDGGLIQLISRFIRADRNAILADLANVPAANYRVWLLASLTLYLSLACTFIPLPTTFVIALASIPAVGLAPDLFTRVVLISSLGAAGTTMANLNDYHVWTFVLRHRKAAAIRQTRLYRTAVRWFSKSAWFTLVAFSLIPIPVDVIRLLAITFQYPRWRFATANYIGRFARYGLLAWLAGSLAEIPGAQWWVVLGFTVLTVGAGLTVGLRRIMIIVRANRRGDELSEQMEPRNLQTRGRT